MASPAVVAAGLPGVSTLTKRLFRGLFTNYVDTNADIRLESAPELRVMTRAQEPQLRNRFGFGPSISITPPNEEENVTPEGVLSPVSGDEHMADQTSSIDAADNPKESLLTVTIRRLSTTFGPSTRAQLKREKQEALDHERGYDLFQKRKYEEYPKGFPRLAAWVSSAQNLEMARGFKYLYQRIILQDVVELTDLEKRLWEADKHEALNPGPNFSLIHTSDEMDGNTTHRELLEKIRVKLKKYNDTMTGYKNLQAFGKPQERNHKAYYNWQWTYPQLAAGSEDYLKHADDMLSLNPERLGYFDNFVEEHVDKFPISMFKGWLQPQEERDKTSDENVTYRSETRRQILAGGLLVLTAVSTLLVPVFLLSLLTSSRAQMTAIASVFILAFAWILYVVEEGKVYRVLLGTATYSAILVVFLNINAVNVTSEVT